ncbi:MAG: DNA-binding protein, partial [Polyangiaceae bacterium]|nr:DNA-binding protein [Polyangiaceae bacterium]
PDGLRAEEIREAIGVSAKELPRPLGDALDGKRITKKGQKRATTYFARRGK